VGELSSAMQALAVALTAALPGRIRAPRLRALSAVVARCAGRPARCDLLASGEQGYANYRGREADLGALRVVIVGQLVVDEAALPPEAGPEALSAAVQDAEFALAEEVKGFLANPAGLRQCLATGFEQSGQMEAPFGWVAFECEVMP